MDKLQQGMFGPIYTQFKGKPKEAIRFLKEQKQGECIAALHRDDIGDIDIVWGKVTDPIKHRGFGLAHIIDKHEADINRLGFQIEDFIPIIVQYGNFNLKKSDSQKMVFEGQGFRFVVAIQKGQEQETKNWLLTAFDLTQKPK